MFFVWPFVMIFRWYSNQNGACGHLNIHLPHRLTAPMEKYTNQMWQPKTRFRGGWSCLRCLVTLAKFDLKTFGWRRGRWLVPRHMWHVNVPCGSLRIHYSWNGSRKEDLWSHGQVETQPVVNRHNTNRSARISIASSGCSEWNMKLDEKKKQNQRCCVQIEKRGGNGSASIDGIGFIRPSTPAAAGPFIRLISGSFASLILLVSGQRLQIHLPHNKAARSIVSQGGGHPPIKRGPTWSSFPAK